jgi:AcrR family transcriptional regulator
MARSTPTAAARSGVPGPLSERRPSVIPPTRDTRDFAQKRAKVTYDALIAAAAKAFAENGFDDTQSPDIARAAGVSVGTFYRYFTDKRQAFIEMISAHLERMYERVIANLTVETFAAARTPEARRAAIDRVIEVVFQNVAEHPRLQHVFLAMSMRDPDVAKIRTDFEERGRITVGALIAQVAPPGRIVDADAAAEVIQIAGQEVAVATMGARSSARTRERATALRAALAEMFYRYVFGDE